ncbi:MAG: diadenylate cyclase CdaA [Saprospiraceae bacterium]|nr:diadenylate cyclase CdaA [Saprospiraceae bacterium]
MIYLVKIGFLPIRIWDILDILIVGYLMYLIYRLLRGSIAFNIFVGVLMLTMVAWLVNRLQMDLLSTVMEKFVEVGVIIIVVIFQPEIRRFLLFLGNTTLRQRSHFWERLLNRNFQATPKKEQEVMALKAVMLRLSKQRIGALIVLSKNANLEGLINSGVRLDAQISEPLIESIFTKESPLHDGALVIANGKLQWASSVLPVSDNPSLPKSVGLRHRAAVGITERSNVAAFVVSEETGSISFSIEGKLDRKLSEDGIIELLKRHYL